MPAEDPWPSTSSFLDDLKVGFVVFCPYATDSNTTVDDSEGLERGAYSISVVVLSSSAVIGWPFELEVAWLPSGS